MHGVMTSEDVKGLRERLGLNQEQFAARVGVSGTTVSRWEQGHSTPSRLAEERIRRLRAPRTGQVRVSTKAKEDVDNG